MPVEKEQPVNGPKQIQSATIEATITRADGTVEHLGVIASTDDGTIMIAPADDEED